MMGNSVNPVSKTEMVLSAMTGIARKHMVHMKKAAAIRNNLLYKADIICKYLLYTVFPIATAPIRLIGLSIIFL